MRYLLGLVLSAPLLLSLFLLPTAAQETDFNRAYNDYLFTYNQYREAHTAYKTAKSTYLTYQTLAAKTEALEKTRIMLKLRADVTIAHLTMLRRKISQTEGVSEADRSLYHGQIDTEVAFLTEHKNRLEAPATIEDLVSAGQEFESRYPAIEAFAYQSIGLVVSGKESALKEKINRQISSLEGFVGQVRQEGVKDTATIERWLLEAKNRVDLSSEKYTQAQESFGRIEEKGDKNRPFTQATFSLEEANQYFKEAATFLKEIILEIKRA